AADPSNPAIVYAAATNGLFKTTDGGTSWVRLNSGLPGVSVGGPFALAPSRPATIYSEDSAQALLLSQDRRATWAPANGQGSHSLPTGGIVGLAVDPANPGTVYAFKGGLFKTTDGGASWDEIVTPTDRNFITAVAIDPNAPSTVYAAENNDTSSG